jgi:uncharacterized protein YicC (UPF0701 family)
MATALAVQDEVGMQAEEIELEHEHLRDEVDDLESALAVVNLDAEPLPELEGLEEADAIVHHLMEELPAHFMSEEARLQLVNRDDQPENGVWTQQLEHQHDAIWRAVEGLASELKKLRSSVELTEDLDRLQIHVEQLRHMLESHRVAEELCFHLLVKQAS